MTEFVANDTGSKLKVTCKDNDTGAAINLTGATVLLRWMDKTGATQSKTMTVTDAANGVAEYQFAAGEIAYPKMSFDVRITDTGGKIITNLAPIEVTVRAPLV